MSELKRIDNLANDFQFGFPKEAYLWGHKGTLINDDGIYKVEVPFEDDLGYGLHDDRDYYGVAAIGRIIDYDNEVYLVEYFVLRSLDWCELRNFAELNLDYKYLFATFHLEDDKELGGIEWTEI